MMSKQDVIPAVMILCVLGLKLSEGDNSQISGKATIPVEDGKYRGSNSDAGNRDEPLNNNTTGEETDKKVEESDGLASARAKRNKSYQNGDGYESQQRRPSRHDSSESDNMNTDNGFKQKDIVYGGLRNNRYWSYDNGNGIINSNNGRAKSIANIPFGKGDSVNSKMYNTGENLPKGNRISRNDKLFHNNDGFHPNSLKNSGHIQSDRKLNGKGYAYYNKFIGNYGNGKGNYFYSNGYYGNYNENYGYSNRNDGYGKGNDGNGKRYIASPNTQFRIDHSFQVQRIFHSTEYNQEYGRYDYTTTASELETHTYLATTTPVVIAKIDSIIIGSSTVGVLLVLAFVAWIIKVVVKRKPRPVKNPSPMAIGIEYGKSVNFAIGKQIPSLRLVNNYNTIIPKINNALESVKSVGLPPVPYLPGQIKMKQDKINSNDEIHYDITVQIPETVE